MNTRQQGLDAETRVLDYLQRQGLRPLARNVRSPRGEIDLIMEEDNFIVFVEVRLRTRSDFGSGAESVTRRKQEKLIATAAYYLQQNKSLAKRPARFDVVSVNHQDKMDWIKNAFEV